MMPIDKRNRKATRAERRAGPVADENARATGKTNFYKLQLHRKNDDMSSIKNQKK